MSLFGKKRIYLDWAAAAPVLPSARRVFGRAVTRFGNPSSPHSEGVAARVLLEASRTQIARLLECKAGDVVFTSGATEANNLAITGMVMHAKKAGAKVHVLYLPSAHASVMETLKSLTKWGVEIEALTVTDGDIDLTRLKSQLRPETRLVVVDAVCGETGTHWDTRGVRNVLQAYEREAGMRPYLHVDGSQTPLALPFSLTHLSADTLSLDAQKVGGIRGVGALCMRPNIPLEPVLLGGGQEGGRRSGTEAVPLIAAFAEALRVAHEAHDLFSKRAEMMRGSLIQELETAFPDMEVNEGKEGAPHILNVSFRGRDTDYAVMLLDKEGFAVGTKSACETDSEAGSRAVLLLTNDALRAASTLRISWGPTTSTAELRRLGRALIRTMRFLDCS